MSKNETGLKETPPALSRFDPHLRSAARVVLQSAGAVLFRYGEPPAWMYFVQHGEVLLQRMTPTGTPILLQRASSGFLAEASLTSARYHCDAVCRSDCTLLAFPVRALRKAIDSDEGTRWAWIEMLGAQLRQQRARIERLTLKTIRERLEHLLLSEGTATEGYAVPGSRLALAAELGVTPEALYRSLAALQAEGCLSIQGERLRWHATPDARLAGTGNWIAAPTVTKT
ncbi:MAG: Crp/Fnr family transcriptional regulator [Burkholderiaceae bacterium]|nr:Crp/Fnr family transcriptional regulator [Burkholderiaceae bacterium]